MIKRLSIRNYAIIQEIDIDFSDNLTIITGETGAGKSILLGALTLILGYRADRKMLYHEDRKCVIEADFYTKKPSVLEYLAQHDFDQETPLTIRREILPSGKSRAFINDSPTKLDVLQGLSVQLIDLHQQFDHLQIATSDFQVAALDAMAKNDELYQEYLEVYRRYMSGKKDLAERSQKRDDQLQRLDYLQFQYQELDSADLTIGEEEELKEVLKRASTKEKLATVTAQASHILTSGETNILDQLRNLYYTLQNDVTDMAEMTSLVGRLDSVMLELEDIEQELTALGAGIDLDEEERAEKEERLNLINQLLNKFRLPSSDDLLAKKQEINEEINTLQSWDDDLQSLEQQIEADRQQLDTLSEKLTKKRTEAGAVLIDKTLQNLSKLQMKHARLAYRMEEQADFTKYGLVIPKLIFSANPGSDLQPIDKVASGGEQSRLALVLKAIVAASIPLPTLIFDEIDAGVSGDVALKMGQILSDLALNHQVVVITHSPQIAAKAQKHYYVYKKVEDNQTYTYVKSLEGDERIRMIAVLLSSDPPSAQAIANAKSLVQAS